MTIFEGKTILLYGNTSLHQSLMTITTSSLTVFKLLFYSICFSQPPCQVWCCRCFVTVLQMRCLRLREVGKFAQGGTAGNEEKPWVLGLLALLASGSCDWNLSNAAFPAAPGAGCAVLWEAPGQGSGRPRLRSIPQGWAGHSCRGLICIKVSPTIFGQGEGNYYF